MHPGNDISNLPVGEILRRTRVHYNQSLDDVEKNLRIRAEQIQAIEDNDIEKLPARVYAIGFVRSYSEYLGLDGGKMVELFKAQSAGHTTQPELHFPVAASESKAPPLWLAFLCLVVLGVVLTFWLGMRDQSREEVETIPEVPATMRAESIEQEQSMAQEPMGPPVPGDDATQSETPESEAAAAETPAEPAPKGITLNIKENSWVEIKDTASGRTVLSRVLNAGEVYFVPDRDNLTMSIGNAQGVELEVNGKPLNSLGEKGQVIRNLPLNADGLLKRYSLQTQNSIDNSAQ